MEKVLLALAGESAQRLTLTTSDVARALASERGAICRRVVVPVLEADPPAALLEVSRELAAKLEATVVLLAVTKDATVAARSRAQALLAACRDHLRGVPVLEQIVSGEPVAATGEAVESGDLVALRAMDPWEAVLSEARCPVLVV
jgi:hypothetical protein